jgi:hypothetical protein
MEMLVFATRMDTGFKLMQYNLKYMPSMPANGEHLELQSSGDAVEPSLHT